MLPEVLRRAGYATAGISANAWVHARSGFDHGFELWRSPTPHRHHHLGQSGWRGRARWYASALRAHLDDGASLIEDQLAQWIDGRDHGPFFWFVNLIECHSPYLPPHPFTDLGPLGRLRSARDARRHQTLEGFWKASLAGWEGHPEELARMQAQYAASIRLLDAWLARIMQHLDSAGLLEETQVVVTSDHGENLGENGLLGHAFSLDDRLIRVPFATAGPVHLDLPARAGLHDLPGAMATAIGLEDHPWTDSVSHPDVVVAEFDAPGQRGVEGTERLVHDWSLDADAADRLCTSFTAATDGRWKLLRLQNRRELLLDLVADPLEQHPFKLDAAGPDPLRAPIEASVLRRLRDALDDAAEAELPPLALETDAADEELGELEEQLRLLGYL